MAKQQSYLNDQGVGKIVPKRVRWLPLGTQRVAARDGGVPSTQHE